MPTHLVFASVAARLDRGEYSPCVVRDLATPPSAPVASVSEPWWTYAAAAAMGALIGILLAS